MQEVMLGTDRLPARRITAFGGGVIGLLVGALIASAGGWFLLNEERAAARNDADILRAGLAGIREEAARKIITVQADALQKQQRLSQLPISYVAAIGARNSREALTAMAAFPDFKTNPYKQLFFELGAMIKEQGDESSRLIAALENPSLSPSNLCSLASGEASAPALWSSRQASLHADGWRGVAP